MFRMTTTQQPTAAELRDRLGLEASSEQVQGLLDYLAKASGGAMPMRTTRPEIDGHGAFCTVHGALGWFPSERAARITADYHNRARHGA